MRILIAGIVCLLASSLSALDLIDTVQSLRQQAWESEFIPESTVPVVPLTDYDEFEVVELFRAETIEELEASLVDGYPYPWLKETLKDETIPWEDRYWLDRRVRSAISQNLHVFFDTEGNPVHVDADGIFPGEFYWREHMIVDPAGWNVPEGAERPVDLDEWDIGHLYDPYGNRVGEIAVPVPRVVALSRDASIGVITSGGNGIYNFTNQPYACFMYPDGSFLEVPFDSIGMYDAIVSPDGSLIAFFCVERLFLPSEERQTSIVPVYLFDKNSNLIRTITPPVPLRWSERPAISEDGSYICHQAIGANTCLIDCSEGTARIIEKPSNYYDQSTSNYSFSPDGEYICLGGSTTGRILELTNSDDMNTYSETEPIAGDRNTRTVVCCSNDQFSTTLTTRRGSTPDFYHELVVYVDDKAIFSGRIPPEGLTYTIQTEVSPNGYYLLVNPANAANGEPIAYGGLPPGIRMGIYNLPLIAMQIKVR
ncbi:MAG: hypothetical protein K8R76_12970 [Candidatus Aegiribacteria sp.]|nr:hypothetical protein [Candidatus Aegiribacteria sp.]